MGADGSYVSNKNQNTFIPVFPIENILDPTGAGDSFAGGFMAYLSQTNNPDFVAAAIMGSAMASFCVEGFGLEALLKVTPRHLEERIKAIESSLFEKPVL